MALDLPVVRAIRRRRRAGASRGTGVGVADGPLEAAGLAGRLRALGPAGAQARDLDRAVTDSLWGMAALSSLTTSLAVDYLERIQHPIPALTLASGVFITTRGYAAHQAVEADPSAYGAADMPVLGTLPPLRRGRPPQDLLSRIVKASKRSFPDLCALDTDVWEGFVLHTLWRVHGQAAAEAADLAREEDLADVQTAYLDVDVVDGLTRFGWLLRQADIHYRLEPEQGLDPEQDLGGPTTDLTPAALERVGTRDAGVACFSGRRRAGRGGRS